MKHKFSSLFLLVLLSLLLTGCQCKHEWIAADCVNPQICSKCEEVGESAMGHSWAGATCIDPETCTRCSETQGEPLGHDWLPASCTAPEACIRCSEAQGEALAHSYGEWSFGENDMTHTCAVCAFEETTELDHELYLESVLTGTWPMLELDAFGNTGSSYLFLSSPEYYSYMTFGENHSCEIILNVIEGKPHLIGTWSLTEHISTTDWEIYLLHVSCDHDYDIVLYISPDGDKIIEFSALNGRFTFSPYNEDPQIIVGNWVHAPNEKGYYTSDQSYWLQFNADQTVTGNVEGKFDGTWHFVPADQEDCVGIYIDCIWNGEQHGFGISFQMNGTYLSSPIFHLSNDGSTISFHEVSEAEFSVIQNATDLLLGTWTSESLHTSSAEEITAEYSITFLENGTFTSVQESGNSYTGRWSCYAHHFDESGRAYDTPYGPKYQYYLVFSGEPQTAYCVLNAQSDSLFLSIDNYPNLGERALHFVPYSESDQKS